MVHQEVQQGNVAVNTSMTPGLVLVQVGDDHGQSRAVLTIEQAMQFQVALAETITKAIKKQSKTSVLRLILKKE